MGFAFGKRVFLRLSGQGIALATFVISAGAACQTSDASPEAHIQSAFATALVLTDSEAIRFGALSFDPEQLPLELDDDRFGSEESLDRRRSVRTFTFPGSWEFPGEESRLTPHLKARLSYLEAEQDFVTGGDGGSGEDTNKDRVYGGYVEGGFSWQLLEKWKWTAGLGAHLMQYDNRYSAGNGFTDVVEPATRGVTFDTHSTAAIGELQTRVKYSSETRGVPWEFQSTYSYYAGETFRADDELGDVEPETWSWANGVAVYWQMPEILERQSRLRFLLRRIDVGGDVTASLGTRQYYEFGVGWLFKGAESNEWLDNFGVGVSVNAGSALSGGSVMLLYNESW